MTTYCDTNQLRANPSKTRVCAFHLRNREAKRELNVVWNGIRLSNTTTPVYLGIHLDRTLCYKTHIEKKHSLTDVPASVKMGLEVTESIAGWIWRGLALLASPYPTAHRGGPCENSDEEMGYLDDAQSVDCDCGEPLTMAHLLSCRLLDEACTADDLATVTERPDNGMRPQVGQNCVKDTKEETKAEVSPSVCTPLSPSLFTPHQILYSPSLNNFMPVCPC